MKKIVFLTGTRADFGKLKSLIDITIKSGMFEVQIFATGMHMQKIFGNTYEEIIKCGFKNIFLYKNHNAEEGMDKTLSNTIRGFSDYVKMYKPDLIIVHGDRVEALAGAIVGALNNILVAHIEGGEISGTIDELIRHAVSKLSHTHFVSNKRAKERLVQMGELKNTIFTIGSPDIDILISNKLPTLKEVKNRYEIEFEEYGILMFHPVTTEYETFSKYCNNLVTAIIESGKNYVIIYPNNDHGVKYILKEYKKLKGNKNFKIFPSIRFEHFITLLKKAKLIVGNSSAGVREAPYFGIPTINIGTRQNNRVRNKTIHNISYDKNAILEAININYGKKIQKCKEFGNGRSNGKFLKIISNTKFWEINKQKQFNDIF